jgi:hypothetical protein
MVIYSPSKKAKSEADSPPLLDDPVDVAERGFIAGANAPFGGGGVGDEPKNPPFRDKGTFLTFGGGGGDIPGVPDLDPGGGGSGEGTREPVGGDRTGVPLLDPPGGGGNFHPIAVPPVPPNVLRAPAGGGDTLGGGLSAGIGAACLTTGGGVGAILGGAKFGIGCSC